MAGGRPEIRWASPYPGFLLRPSRYQPAMEPSIGVAASRSRPRITAMDHGLAEKARLATDLLFQLIDGSAQPHRWSPVGTLLVRESTGPAPH